MSLYFDYSDWMLLTQTLYEIHRIFDRESYATQALELIRQMIPFSVGIFYQTGAPDMIAVHGVPEESIEQVKNEIATNAFMRGLAYNMVASPVMHGPSVAQFSRDFSVRLREIIATDVEHALSCALHYEGEVLGYVTLWRSNDMEGFAQRDTCVLTYLKSHLELCLHRFRQKQGKKCEGSLNGVAKKFHLTEREMEVLSGVYKGMSEAEICEQMCIASSTYKKHLYHVYNKVQVNSKLKLIREIEKIQG